MALDSTLGQLISTLVQMDVQLAQQGQQSEAARARIAELEGQMAEREATIARLQVELATATSGAGNGASHARQVEREAAIVVNGAQLKGRPVA